MFTGIVTDMGTVASINDDGGDWRIGIQTALDLSKTDIGASIACAGCCLTVVEKQNDIFFVDVSGETLSKTNIGQWQEGTKVNMEPSLKVGDELGGHIVSGHIDGVTELKMMNKEGDSHRLVFMAPPELESMFAPKGSITLDGVSLTVNEVEDQHFGVNIIPHTWENTTLGQLKTGDKVHIEVDVLARYVARTLHVQSS